MHEWISILETTLSNNFTFSVIFILGMFHALEPGHGKTLIIAYMTGGSMRFSGAAQLISGLILVHFLLFSLLAFLLKAGNESFPILTTIGPSFIICLGFIYCIALQKKCVINTMIIAMNQCIFISMNLNFQVHSLQVWLLD